MKIKISKNENRMKEKQFEVLFRWENMLIFYSFIFSLITRPFCLCVYVCVLNAFKLENEKNHKRRCVETIDFAWDETKRGKGGLRVSIVF